MSSSCLRLVERLVADAAAGPLLSVPTAGLSVVIASPGLGCPETRA
jgi:hypothetical protein